MIDKQIKKLEEISTLFSKNGEFSDELMQEVEQGLKKALTELSKKVNRLEELINSGVLEKAAKLPKRGGIGKGKKLVATTEEEKEIYERAREAVILSTEIKPELEKIEELKKVLSKFSKKAGVKPTLLTGLQYMPTGTAIHTVQEVITAGGREGIEALPERKKQINHSSKYSVAKGDPIRPEEEGLTIVRYDLGDKRSYIRIGLPDNTIDKNLGFGIFSKKLFLFFLQKINQQVLSSEGVLRDFITFPAQELIDKGFYSVQRSAREGFESAANILTSIKLQGELWYSKRNAKHIFQLSVLFPTARYEDGECKVFLNRQVDWGFIYQAFSILPDYYYELSNKPSELLYYIFFIARQHTEDIKERGYFTISCRAIQLALHLPSEKKTEHPDRDIKQQILNAIESIDKAQNKYFHDEELLFLSLEYEDEWNITQFLNKGYLQVNLSGEFAEPFINFEKEKIKKLKEAQRKKQKAIEAKKSKEN